MAYSLEAKIVVLGSQGVGKTSLVNRYVKNHFNPKETTSTVGASFLTKKVVDDESDTTVRLQIWDTAGQERFRSISRLYYRGANACILCYSITDAHSFSEMGTWLRELRSNLPTDIILHIVGTKSDIVAKDPTLRAVPFERCIAYVAEHLAPGQSASPPVTAGGGDSGGGGGGLRGGLAGVFGRGYSAANVPIAEFSAPPAAAINGATSPSSKRSSGFWGQDIGWDCCHEVSAESGEGVDEVFRVITSKLVEQNRKMMGLLSSAAGSTPGMMSPVGGDGGDYFTQQRPGGSFRVGRDRRSWFGVPVENYIEEGTEEGVGAEVKTRRKCC